MLPRPAADTCSNSIRVVKTTKQTATEPLTYPQAVKVGGGWQAGSAAACSRLNPKHNASPWHWHDHCWSASLAQPVAPFASRSSACHCCPAPPQMVVEKDGVIGLFGRGLKTKIVANGMQVGLGGVGVPAVPGRVCVLARVQLLSLPAPLFVRMGGWAWLISRRHVHIARLARHAPDASACLLVPVCARRACSSQCCGAWARITWPESREEESWHAAGAAQRSGKPAASCLLRRGGIE